MAHKFFRVGRLRGSSDDNHFPLFNVPYLSAGLEAYKKTIDPWFVNLRNYHFATAENGIDFLQATARVAFDYKTNQDPSVLDPLRKEIVTRFQTYCTDQNADAAPMTMIRWEHHETALCTACAAAKVGMIFNAKSPFEKARPLQTPAANLVSTAILALGKATEALNLRQLTTAGPRGDLGRGRVEARAAYEPSCFWCGNKGHTLIDCTVPAPNPASKLARNDMIAVREKRDRDNRNADREGRHLASAATCVTVGVSGDEGEDDDYSEATYEAIQALFGQLTEPTKP